jgi:hypothetical protein
VKLALKVVAGSALVVAALGVTVACTPFSSDSGAAGSSKGGAPEGGLLDASGLEPDASTPDAAAFDAGRLCSPPACEDFESPTWTTAWLVGTAPSAPTVTNGTATSGTRALDVVISDNTTSYVVHGASGATKLTLTANVLVAQMGDGDVDLLGIGESATPGSQGVYLVHQASLGQVLSVEQPGNQQTALASGLSTFTPVRLELDLVAQTYAYTIGAAPRIARSFSYKPSLLGATFFLGVTYASGVTKPWHIRYDDVAITAQ